VDKVFGISTPRSTPDPWHLQPGSQADSAAADELQQAMRINPKLRRCIHSSGWSICWVATANRRFRISTELESIRGLHLANSRLGWLLRETGSWRKLPRCCTRTRTRPDDPGRCSTSRSLFRVRAKTEEAVRLLERVVRQLPDYSPAHVLLARMYFKLKRLKTPGGADNH